VAYDVDARVSIRTGFATGLVSSDMPHQGPVGLMVLAYLAPPVWQSLDSQLKVDCLACLEQRLHSGLLRIIAKRNMANEEGTMDTSSTRYTTKVGQRRNCRASQGRASYSPKTTAD
jgi:hypothetical protein